MCGSPHHGSLQLEFCVIPCQAPGSRLAPAPYDPQQAAEQQDHHGHRTRCSAAAPTGFGGGRKNGIGVRGVHGEGHMVDGFKNSVADTQLERDEGGLGQVGCADGGRFRTRGFLNGEGSVLRMNERGVLSKVG